MSLPDDKRSRGSWLAIVLAACLAFVVFATLFVLTLQISGLVTLAAAVLFLFGGFHYFVWGWWLGPLIHQDVAAEEQTEAARIEDSKRRADRGQRTGD